MDDLYANWAGVYDSFYLDRTAEVDLWARLANPCGQRVLDLMCGTAEVSLGLARRGYTVLGIDLSAAMLSKGVERVAAAADHPARRLSLGQGDAGHLPAADGAFDFAFVGGSGSFNHLGDQPASATLQEVCRVLRPGGGLGMELANPYLLQKLNPERTFGSLRPTPPDVWVERTCYNHYDQERGLFQIRQVTSYRVDGQHGEFEECFALRVWEPDEVQALLEGAGFERVQYFGGFDLEPFDPWSPDLLVVAASSGHY